MISSFYLLNVASWCESWLIKRSVFYFAHLCSLKLLPHFIPERWAPDSHRWWRVNLPPEKLHNNFILSFSPSFHKTDLFIQDVLLHRFRDLNSHFRVLTHISLGEWVRGSERLSSCLSQSSAASASTRTLGSYVGRFPDLYRVMSWRVLW